MNRPKFYFISKIKMHIMNIFLCDFEPYFPLNNKNLFSFCHSDAKKISKYDLLPPKGIVIFLKKYVNRKDFQGITAAFEMKF